MWLWQLVPICITKMSYRYLIIYPWQVTANLKKKQWSRETNAKCSNKIESTDSNHYLLFSSIPWSIDSFHHWPTLTLWYHPQHTPCRFSFRLYQRKGTPRDSWSPQLVGCFFDFLLQMSISCSCRAKHHHQTPQWSPSKQKDGGRVLVRGREVPIFWVCNSSPVGMGDILTSLEEKMKMVDHGCWWYGASSLGGPLCDTSKT